MGGEKRGVIVRRHGESGFTLIELLVVMSIISLLMGIMVPTYNRVRRHTRAMRSMTNQREITSNLNLFASDNDERYPESVATVGTDDYWNWSDPTKLAGTTKRTPSSHRAMSEYLRSYMPDARTLYCPNAPQRYEYLQMAWDAGDDWDFPKDGAFSEDPLGGTYCFYWNYIGYVGGPRVLFRGPRGPADGGRRYSKLLVTDYFGYDHWRSPWSHGSCEPFEGAKITPETWLLSGYWSKEGDPESPPNIQMRAGFTDGHVETYTPSDVMPMKVSISADGTTPYPDGVGPGIFYLPRTAFR